MFFPALRCLSLTRSFSQHVADDYARRLAAGQTECEELMSEAFSTLTQYYSGKVSPQGGLEKDLNSLSLYQYLCYYVTTTFYLVSPFKIALMKTNLSFDKTRFKDNRSLHSLSTVV